MWTTPRSRKGELHSVHDDAMEKGWISATGEQKLGIDNSNDHTIQQKQALTSYYTLGCVFISSNLTKLEPALH